MGEFSYIEFLIEDSSGGILLEHVMKKYVSDKADVKYRIHRFKGIGKIPQKAGSISQVKTRRQ